ncbi:pentatricopeptide repeat-containing protein At1g28690, mitochondrial [Ricinus communis]|uniref:pentatricopeptide repeat-containing protein At1g28690, mitochondrial n=1 Tax=Ricinus communis TaxID=3988 RepID=UPI00201AF9F5|nr:pentatricopeptide repeat-containing protein At1g28690, mitochondrial [Ricinus communis]
MKNAKFCYVTPCMLSSTKTYTSHAHSNPILPPNEEYLFRSTAAALSSALQDHINSNTPFHGQKIHAHIVKTGFIPNTNVSIKLLILYLKCGCLKYARQMFDELPQRTLSAYNYLIGGYLKLGLVQDSMNLVRRLVLEGQRPDGFTYSMILKASTSGDNVTLSCNLGSVVHGQILKSEVEPDDVLYTALVDSYVKSGRVGYARKVFDMMMEKNVICSTSMISGYMNRGSVEDAEEIFERTVEKDVVVFNAMIEGYSKSVQTAEKALEVYVEMQRYGFRPNLSTFASVIGACSVLAGFEIGQQVQGQLLKSEFFTNVKTGSALIDMYSKCGRIEDARRAFEQMPEKNVFSWSSMIDGYGKNGRPDEALQLFHKMQDCCIEPNYVTFLGALSACGHAGLVSKGREIFESMEREYSLKPGMEHYACMVDLLGRAGSLNLAWEFVMGMPEKASSDVWAALLSACNLHGNVEMASVAANELFKLNAEGRSGAYVALSNTLAAAGKWDGVTEVREIMKSRGILKDTGSSWVGTESVL